MKSRRDKVRNHLSREEGEGEAHLLWGKVIVMKKLIEHYGVKVGHELVLDQLNANASFRSGMYNIMVPYPFWVRTIRKNVEGYHPTINNLESMVFPWTSSLTIDKEKTKIFYFCFFFVFLLLLFL